MSSVADETPTDDDMECTTGNTWVRTGCIFSYNGSTKDILLNYFILAVNLTYCSATLIRHGKDRQRVALYSLLGVALFQWVLCLIVGCSGISIIWCAICGWMMNERRQLHEASNEDDGTTTPPTNLSTNAMWQRLEEDYGKGIILLNLLVVVYYAIVMEPITTVAHVCALILGAALNIAALNLTNGSRSMSTSQDLLASPHAPLLQGNGVGEMLSLAT